MNKIILHEKYKKFFELEEPYGFMIEELVHSLYEKNGQIQGNYLTAVGLFCYSEVIGRKIIRYKFPDREYIKNKECFNLFFKEYMGYEKLLGEYEDIYDWYRNGLCHNYEIKGLDSAKTGGVFVYYDSQSRGLFEIMGVDTTKGIALSKKSKRRVFIILPYLDDFIRGIEKFLEEKKYAL